MQASTPLVPDIQMHHHPAHDVVHHSLLGSFKLKNVQDEFLSLIAKGQGTVNSLKFGLNNM